MNQSFGDCTKCTHNNWYNRHFHVPQFFSNFLTRSRHLSIFSLSFNFTQCSARKKVNSSEFSFLFLFFFLLIIIWSGRLVDIKGFVSISKFQRILCVSFSKTDAGLFVWSNFNFLHNSQWIPLPNRSCLVLYSFCANLQHSLIIWLIVSSWSLHYQHLMFCCILSILTLIWLILMVLFCASIRRDSDSLLKF